MTTKLSARILVVEDEMPMRVALVDCLAAEGYRILTAVDGNDGLKKALDEQPDIILLDVMMPRLDGVSLCAELRRAGRSTPVLFLTAKGQVQDKIRGFDAGADDYLVKPFSIDELLARVRALLRRHSASLNATTTLTLGLTQIDFQRQTATRGGQIVPLTAKEFAMLRLLAQHAGSPVTREQFLDQVWQYASFPTTRTVDNHIASLREKLGDEPADPKWIITVHGVGYRLVTTSS